jgi:hypothetical protein
MRTPAGRFLGLAALMLTLAPPAGAITFGPPVTVSPPGVGFTPSPPAVAVSAGADVVVAWSTPPHDAVYVAYRRRGGSFQRPQRLTRRRVEGTDVDVAIAASGEALVTWAENETLAALGRARARVVVARRAPGRGRRFGRPVELSRGQAGAHDPEVDMTAGGEAVAVWEELTTRRRGTSPRRISAAVRPAGGAFGAPVALSDAQRGFRAFPGPLLLERMVPRVAVLPSGAALAVWERASGVARACCQRVEAAIRPAGGAFGAPAVLTEAAEGSLATIREVKGAGARWGVLAHNDAALQLIEAPEPGGFSAPQPVPGAPAEFGEAALALSPDGAASVLEQVPLAPESSCADPANPTGAYALATTSRPAGGAFGAEHLVTPPALPGAYADATVAGGRAIFSWDRPRRAELGGEEPITCDRFGDKPYGADGVPGADPGPAVPASRARADGRAPVLAADPAGAAVLAWIGGNGRVRVARVGGGGLGRNRYPDITPPRLIRPRLSPARVPPGGVVTLRLRLSEAARLTLRLLDRTLRVRRPRGAATIRFRASDSAGRPLRRGPYRVEVGARDRAGNRADFVSVGFGVR